jgi:isoleucyl-tRNA synthetase
MNTKVNGKQKNLVLAENLVEDFCKISGLINEGLVTYDVTKHWGAVHPIYKTIRPLLPADFVKDTTGTGFVHIAPAHGEDDFQLGKKHKLLTRSTIDDQGMMTEVLFEGVHVYKGDEAVKNALGEHLIACNTIVHSYPHSWRSKKPVIYKTTPQWFISVEGIREQALNALNDVGFYPAGGRNRITSMIKSRGDWCISRQRAWGVPIMIFLDNNGNILKDDVVNNRIKDTVSALGCDAWFNLPNDFFLHGYKNPNDYTKVMDVLDVWFDSGSTFSFSLNDHLPVDLYLEGSDQHRGWFQSSLLVGVGTIGVAPYKNLLTHGFVLDGNGRKMAKSEGNVVSPNDVISKYGVETLRMWVASSDYTEDLKISMNTVATTNTDMLGKIRNTLRFIIMNLNDNKVVDTVPYKDLPELEKLMLLQVYELDKRLREYLCNYEYHKIVSDIHRFCVNNLSSYYFTMKKDSLYCDAENSISRRACLTVLDVCFKYLTCWLSPIIPFTIDEITQLRYNCKSGEYFHKILETCPEEWNTYNNVYKWQQLDIVRDRVLSEIEKLRANKVVGSSYEVVLKTYLLEDLDTTGINLLDFFGVSKIETSASIELVVQKIDGEKCPRCWTYHNHLINDVCPRCNEVLKG